MRVSSWSSSRSESSSAWSRLSTPLRSQSNSKRSATPSSSVSALQGSRPSEQLRRVVEPVVVVVGVVAVELAVTVAVAVRLWRPAGWRRPAARRHTTASAIAGELLREALREDPQAEARLDGHAAAQPEELLKLVRHLHPQHPRGADGALANTARAPSRLNTTVFLSRPRMEVLPADLERLADRHVHGANRCDDGILLLLPLGGISGGGTQEGGYEEGTEGRRHGGAARERAVAESKFHHARISAGCGPGLSPVSRSSYSTTIRALVVELNTSRPVAVTATRSSIRTPPRPGR